MYTALSKDFNKQIGASVQYFGMVFKVGSCIEKSLNFDHARDKVERAQFGTHYGNQVQRCRSREAITVFSSELATEPSLRQFSIFGKGCLGGDKQ